MAKKGKRKEIVHIHYVHHIYHVPPQSAAAPIMVHAAMPGQPHADIMTAPGFHAPHGPADEPTTP